MSLHRFPLILSSLPLQRSHLPSNNQISFSAPTFISDVHGRFPESNAIITNNKHILPHKGEIGGKWNRNLTCFRSSAGKQIACYPTERQQMTDLEITKHSLFVPSQHEVAALFQRKLADYFDQVTVSVVDCPDLRSEPFHLAQSGLAGREAICDVGGVPYLFPLAQTDKKYSLSWIADKLSYEDGAFFVGAAAGPCHALGTNSELMPNFFKEKKSVRSETHIAKLDPDSAKGYQLRRLEDLAPACDEFCLLGNLFLSEGRAGKVIRVNVKKRKTSGHVSFPACMRSVLRAEYGDEKQVSLGGVFLITSGRVKLHVMPDFSSTPLLTDQQANEWLQYFEGEAPLICLTTFHSVDLGQDLRIEHTHCFSKHGDGGHYHYDTTPDDVEYVGYFSIAETLYRIDAPEQSHMIGRD